MADEKQDETAPQGDELAPEAGSAGEGAAESPEPTDERDTAQPAAADVEVAEDEAGGDAEAAANPDAADAPATSEEPSSEDDAEDEDEDDAEDEDATDADTTDADAEDEEADAPTADADSSDDEPEPAATPTPARRPRRPTLRRGREGASERRRAARAETDHDLPRVRAKARFVRTAPRKARLVADQIRGKHVEDARVLLEFSPRRAARDFQKLLASAIANAENNHELIGEELRIVEIRVDEGPTLRRYRPRAQGRATPINKRTSHLSIQLVPTDED